MIIMPCTRLCMTDEKKCIQKLLCVNSLREKKGEHQRDVKKYSDERKKIQVNFFLTKKKCKQDGLKMQVLKILMKEKNSGENFFEQKITKTRWPEMWVQMNLPPFDKF